MPHTARHFSSVLAVLFMLAAAAGLAPRTANAQERAPNADAGIGADEGNDEDSDGWSSSQTTAQFASFPRTTRRYDGRAALAGGGVGRADGGLLSG